MIYTFSVDFRHNGLRPTLHRRSNVSPEKVLDTKMRGVWVNEIFGQKTKVG
jgi:hypothetical protein